MLDVFNLVFIAVGLSLVVIRHPTMQRITPAVFYFTITAFILTFSIAFLLREFRPNTDAMTFADLRDLPGYIQSFQVFKNNIYFLFTIISDPYAHYLETWTEAEHFGQKVFLVCSDLNCPALMQPLIYVIGMVVQEATNSPKVTLLSIQLLIIAVTISASLSFFSEIATANQKVKIPVKQFKYGATLLFLSSGLIFWALGSWLRWGFAIVITLHLLIAVRRDQPFGMIFISILAMLTHTGSIFLLPVILFLSSNKWLRRFAAFTGLCLAVVTFNVMDGPHWQMNPIPLIDHIVKVTSFSVGDLSGKIWVVLALLIALLIKPVDRYLQLIPIPHLPFSIALAGLLLLTLDLSYGSGPTERVALGYVIIFSLFVLDKFKQTQTSELLKTQVLGIMGILLYFGALILYFPSGTWL